MEAAQEDETHRVPGVWNNRASPALWTWQVALEAQSDLVLERLFTADSIELFHEKSSREGEFKQSLDAPLDLEAEASRDGVDLRWRPPDSLSSLRSKLSGQSLLSAGFQVYRWRKGEEPELLARNEASRTFYRDEDLPLWSERFLYCVATVLEGTIGNLPTLIESQPSSVIEVETPENFTVDILDGTADSVRLDLAAHAGGSWHRQSGTFGRGARITFDAVVEGTSRTLDTGLTVEDITVEHGTEEEPVERLEFLPDGRLKLDPTTGTPATVTELVPVAVRTLTVRCRDPGLAGTRTLTSGPLR